MLLIFVDLQFSVPVDIISLCPGESVLTSYLVRVPEMWSEAEMLTHST